jgi:hypothetical protein
MSGFVDNITHWNIDMERSLTSCDNSEMINEETMVAAQWWEEFLYNRGKVRTNKMFLLSDSMGFRHCRKCNIKGTNSKHNIIRQRKPTTCTN